MHDKDWIFEPGSPRKMGSKRVWVIRRWCPLHKKWWETVGNSVELHSPRDFTCLGIAYIFSILIYVYLTCMFLVLFSNTWCLHCRPGLDLARFPICFLRMAVVLPDYTLVRVHHVIAWSFQASTQHYLKKHMIDVFVFGTKIQKCLKLTETPEGSCTRSFSRQRLWGKLITCWSFETSWETHCRTTRWFFPLMWFQYSIHDKHAQLPFLTFSTLDPSNLTSPQEPQRILWSTAVTGNIKEKRLHWKHIGQPTTFVMFARRSQKVTHYQSGLPCNPWG